MEYIQPTINYGSLFISVIAVLIAGASHRWTRRTHVLAPKRDVLRRLLGGRHLLTDAMSDHRGPGEPYIALNEIVITYSGDPEVIGALKRYSKETSIVNLKILIRKMAKAAGSSLDNFNDDLLDITFRPSSP